MAGENALSGGKGSIRRFKPPAIRSWVWLFSRAFRVTCTTGEFLETKAVPVWKSVIKAPHPADKQKSLDASQGEGATTSVAYNVINLEQILGLFRGCIESRPPNSLTVGLTGYSLFSKNS
jgi:hypothetical protein